MKRALLQSVFLFLVAWPARATVMNEEYAAVLVFPLVLDESVAGQPTVETFITIRHSASDAVRARLRFVQGTSCLTCVPLTIDLQGYDSDTIVVSRNLQTGDTLFRNLDDGTVAGCPQGNGFVVVSIDDSPYSNPSIDNRLAGSEVVVDYALGTTFSVSPVGFEGDMPHCRTCLHFDGQFFRPLPAALNVSFLAPDPSRSLDARLALFTLGLRSGAGAPVTTCNLTRTSASGAQTTTQFSFGCWMYRSLADIDPGVTYPQDGEQGWLSLSCTVDGAMGGVHGALVQTAAAGARVRRTDPGPPLGGATSWARQLMESAAPGDSMAFCPGDRLVEDVDGDDVPNTCDNCPAAPNTSQQDGDHDHLGDACDCAPSDPLNPPPREVALLRVGDLAPQTIIWSVESAATSYDLLRGSLAALPVGPGGGDEVCFNDIGGNTTTDASSPTVGSGFWYLVRGSNACGTGSFGSEGAHGVPAGERTSATCP